jgi:hypothetical protein
MDVFQLKDVVDELVRDRRRRQKAEMKNEERKNFEWDNAISGSTATRTGSPLRFFVLHCSFFILHFACRLLLATPTPSACR